MVKIHNSIKLYDISTASNPNPYKWDIFYMYKLVGVIMESTNHKSQKRKRYDVIYWLI
jgi:hypothetical protein